jgi:predicted RNA-binding Zn-ribbon protein involved in translation (DUF1610 family)
VHSFGGDLKNLIFPLQFVIHAIVFSHMRLKLNLLTSLLVLLLLAFAQSDRAVAFKQADSSAQCTLPQAQCLEHNATAHVCPDCVTGIVRHLRSVLRSPIYLNQMVGSASAFSANRKILESPILNKTLLCRTTIVLRC